MVILTDLSEVLIRGFDGIEKKVGVRYGREICNRFWERKTALNDEFFRPLLRGAIHEDDYWEEFMKKQHFPFSMEEIKMIFSENMAEVIPGTLRMYERIIAYPRNLDKRDVRMGEGRPEIYLVSDHIDERLVELHETHPEIFDLVDKEFWSCHIGRLKSDPGFFKNLVRKENLQFGETILIDDLKCNVLAAAKEGITSFQFLSASQIENQLRHYGFKFAPATAKNVC